MESIGIIGVTASSYIAAVWARRVSPRSKILLILHGDGIIYDSLPAFLADRISTSSLTLGGKDLMEVALRVRVGREYLHEFNFDKVGLEKTWIRVLTWVRDDRVNEYRLDKIDDLLKFKEEIAEVREVGLEGYLPEVTLLAQGLIDLGVKVTSLRLRNITKYFDNDMLAYVTKLLKEEGISLNGPKASLKLRRNVPDFKLPPSKGVKRIDFGELKTEKDLLTGREEILEDLGLGYRRALIAGIRLGGLELKVKGYVRRIFFRLSNIRALSIGLKASEVANLRGLMSTRIRCDELRGNEAYLKLIGDREARRLLGVQLISTAPLEEAIGYFESMLYNDITLDEGLTQFLFSECTYPLLRGGASNALTALWVKAGIPS